MSTVTGECVLVDRFPYGNPVKVLPIEDSIAKNHVQISHDADDDITLGSGGYIAAATGEVEERGCVSLIKQQRILVLGSDVLSELSGQSIHLPFGPIISVTGVTYLDEDENEQALPSENYRASARTSSIYFKGTLPTIADGPDTVWISYESGFGEAATDVPAAWRNCVSTLLSRKYDYRGGDSGSTNIAFERMFRSMILAAGAKYRA